MFRPYCFNVNGYRFSTAAKELKESYFKLLFLLLNFILMQTFWSSQACSLAFVEVIAQGNIGIEAGNKGVGKTIDINAFFVSVIPIFGKRIGLSNLFIAYHGLGLYVVALASTFFLY